MVAFVLGWLGLLMPQVAVILGIVSLVLTEAKRGLAIAGIVVGILTAIGMVFVDLFALLISTNV
jgi:hypothetical protein